MRSNNHLIHQEALDDEFAKSFLSDSVYVWLLRTKTGTSRRSGAVADIRQSDCAAYASEGSAC